MRDGNGPIARFQSAPVAAMMVEVRAMPAVMATDVVRTMPAMVTADAVMRAIAMTMMAAILHFRRHAFTGALHGGCNARIVERDRVRLLRRRSHEHQAGDGGKAEKLFQVHVFSPRFRVHRIARCMAMTAHG